MLKSIVIATTLGTLALGGKAAESYVCAADHAAGIKFDNASKRWSGTVFRADEKVVLSLATSEEAQRGAAWVVKELGKSFPSFVCKEGFNDAGYIHCVGFGEFRFNRKNGRYLSTYTMGYVDDGLSENTLFGKEGANTPAVKVGKCSRIQ
jgi:hypothetical protein